MKWPSKKVRDTFIQYFINHGSHPHKFVRASSIVPKNDPSLAFVNAGMNQFKDVILGYGRPESPRATNTQKCLRINDLSLVGADTYHHTFFEMLGNWSFSDYFKEEACAMAWELLTNVYKLDPNRLFVTYFSGNGSVPQDLATKQIWEKIGVNKSRILPFNNENFWKMGSIGPCGPSTEIHYDHRGDNLEPGGFVNSEDGLVVEIWNLVFMQYNLNSNGELERLPLSHVVDTGAGLERLAAVLNGKTSNYDTDLFTPVFKEIKRLSGGEGYGGRFNECQIDTGYRVFADHMRAVTVALADGVLPQTNQKIRKLIQRTLATCDQNFNTAELSTEDRANFLIEAGVTPVSKTLGDVFPEISSSQEEIKEILQYEVNRYTEFAIKCKGLKTELPPILLMNFPALARIPSQQLASVRETGIVNGELAYSWYDSLGVTSEAIEDLCQTYGLQFDVEGMNAHMNSIKKKLRHVIAAEMIENEDKIFTRKVESMLGLYDPKLSGGICEPTTNLNGNSVVEWIFDEHGDPVNEVTDCQAYFLVLSKTAFVPGSENFQSDQGVIVLENGNSLNVESAKRLPSGWILHYVTGVPEIGLARNVSVKEFRVRNDIRFGREMSANSLAHVKWWLHQKFGVVRYSNEAALADRCGVQVTILNGDLDKDVVASMEKDLNEYGMPVVLTKKRNPGKKEGVSELTFATGLTAEQARRFGNEVTTVLQEIEEICGRGDINLEVLQVLAGHLSCVKKDEVFLPYGVYSECDRVSQLAEKVIWKSNEVVELSRICSEMEQEDGDFIVRVFSSDAKFSSLKKVTRIAESQDKPCLVLIRSSDGFVVGRAVVPKLGGNEMSAMSWMGCVAKELGNVQISPPKGQDERLVVNLKRVRIYDEEEKIENALNVARQYICDNYKVKLLERSK